MYDITGQKILDEKGDGIHVSRTTLDLDRGVYHQNFNIDPRDKLLAEHGDEIEQSMFLDREQWFVLRAKKPGVSARKLANSYGLEELRDYVERSRRAFKELRGTPLAAD